MCIRDRKEKSQIEKKAEARQAELLSAALSGASNAGGHWLNVSAVSYTHLQDVLIDAGYHLNRRDGLRYPSYVRLDSEGRRRCV